MVRKTPMTDPRCEQLDEYLCGWLSPDEAAGFEAHLAACPTCREEATLQRQIDRLLAEETAQIEPVPVALAGRIERAVRAARRRRLVGWAGAVTTAAGIVLAVGLWAAQNLFFPRDDGRPMAHTPAVPTDAPEPSAPFARSEPPSAAPVRVTLVDPSSAILVPIESHSPNVTLVCVYPTTKVDREGDSEPSQ